MENPLETIIELSEVLLLIAFPQEPVQKDKGKKNPSQ